MARVAKQYRSYHNLTHPNKLTCDMGYCIPVYWDYWYPGESFKVMVKSLARMLPQVYPVFDDVRLGIDFWRVPFRLVFPDWDKFITGGKNGDDSTPHPRLQIPVGGYAVGSLMDYLDVPPLSGAGLYISSLPVRAYNLIWNENYRNQNFQDERDLDDVLLAVKNRYKDYFRSALPWPQRGPAVELPVGIGGNANVFLDPDAKGTSQIARRRDTHALPNDSGTRGLFPAYGTVGYPAGTLLNDLTSGREAAVLDPNGTLKADLSTAVVDSITVNDLRLSFQIQKWAETNARAGVRLVEHILANWGVRTSDASLQRPQFLGSFSMNFLFSEVLQTSSTDTTSPQGNLAGHAIASGVNRPIKAYFDEHMIVMAIMHILPRNTYQNGIRRQFNYETRYDYPNPHFVNLGEQGIKKKEIFADSADPEGIFGYQGRYDELRHRFGAVHGHMRTTYAHSHFGSIYTTEPVLSSEFVSEPVTKRAFAVQDEHTVQAEILFIMDALRRVPAESNPGLIDH